MSGTSLDGLDIAHCHIYREKENWKFKILQTKSIDYDAKFSKYLKNSVQLSAVQLLQLHNEYGEWLGLQTKNFIKKHSLQLDFIASHGHTVHHQPDKGITFQIGSGQHLANTCNEKVICDFRTNDVALGGQGAPLVPIGDQLFFGEYDFCLNLGGISNVSFVKNGKRIAYDIGLANMILNHTTQKAGLLYDKGGEIAGKGTVNSSMLNQLNELEYYKLPFPKSTGYEWFAEKVVPIVDKTKDNLENKLHTAIQHISETVAHQLKINSEKKESKVLVTGGGALNTFMMKCLGEKLGKSIQLNIPPKKLIEFKEALVFALMGALRDRNEVNCLKSVTGASKDSSSGVIYRPK